MAAESSFIENLDESPTNEGSNCSSTPSSCSLNPTLFQENYETNGTTKNIIQYIKPKPVIPNGIMLIPVWLVVLSLLSIIAISIIFSGAIFVYMAPRPSLYGESCAGRSCVKGLNLKCINNICACPTSQYYSKGCHDKKDISSKCIGNISNCFSNLVCLDGVCKCEKSYYWNNGKCVSQKSYGGSCTSDAQCNNDLLLYCDLQRKKCLCHSDRYWDETVCYPKRGYQENCLNSSTSYMCKYSTEGTVCSLDSNLNYTCQCSQYEYYDTLYNKCLLSSTLGGNCLSDSACTSGLMCSNGTCSCNSTQYFDGLACINKKQYGAACTYSYECDTTKSLICSTNCDCPLGLNYSYTANTCNLMKTYQESCTTSSDCDNTQNLICRSGVCDCINGVRWFWAKKSLSCKNCPNSWTIYNGYCYYISIGNAKTWNDAENDCKSNGGNLLSINNNNEFNISSTYFQNIASSQIWIGASRTSLASNFIWNFDNSSLITTSSFWCPSEPNNGGSSGTTIVEGCVVMKIVSSSACLSDLQCGNQYDFFCEMS